MTGATLPRPASVDSPPAERKTVPHLRAVALVLFAALLNAAYLLIACPAELAPDEAHYWQWSRHLDYCYYSKGPLVAWLIRGGCELFGDVSIRLTGDEAAAVRSPAVLCGALLFAGVYVLAYRTTRSESFALATVAAGLTVPAIPATGVLVTIDSPLLACWAWATVFVQRAVFRGGTWPWVAAGVISAIGVLGKYTMLGFPGCVGLFLLANPSFRSHLWKPGFWIFAALTACGMLPILVWNANHDWIGFRHLFALAGATRVAGKPLVDPLGPIAFLGGQAGVLLGYWFVVWAAAAVSLRNSRDPRVTFLWWLSVPVWLAFAASSVRGTAEANWTAPAFVTGWVLGGVWLRDRLYPPPPLGGRVGVGGEAIPPQATPTLTLPPPRGRGPEGHLYRRCLAAAVCLGIAVTICGRYPSLIRPLLAEVCPTPTTDKPAPIRQLDPTTRLAGWTTLAKEVDRVREAVRREDGQDPVVVASSWSIPGELAFYCAGHPATYSVGLALTDRHSQYDIWRPNPVADAQAFRGRTFVCVGYRTPVMEQGFERVEPPVEVIASDGGVPIATWEIWVCRGFRGFPTNGGRSAGAGY